MSTRGGHALLELLELLVEARQRLVLDPRGRLAQLLPLRQLRDSGGAVAADGVRGGAEVAAQLRIGERRGGGAGKAVRCSSRHPAVENLGEVHDSHPGVQSPQPAGDMHQAGAVGRGQHLGLGGEEVRDLVGQHRG